MAALRSVTVFACGEPLRGDDGLAAATVALLPRAVRARVDLRCVPELRTEDLAGLPLGTRVVVVDAVKGPPPGTLLRFGLHELTAHAGDLRTVSTHQLPLAAVVELASLLAGPHEGSFLGLAGASFDIGGPISAPVNARLPALRDALVDEIERLAATT